jgi:hypothetical protein
MPPAGWKSGRGETVLKTVRMPEAMMERVNQHIERLQAQFTFARVTENMALRDLLERGLKAAEAKAETKPSGEQLILPVDQARATPTVESAPPGASAIEQAAAVAAVDTPPFDTTRFYLGKLCPQGHQWGSTGQSLLRRHNQRCRECENAGRRQKPTQTKRKVKA